MYYDCMDMIMCGYRCRCVYVWFIICLCITIGGYRYKWVYVGFTNLFRHIYMSTYMYIWLYVYMYVWLTRCVNKDVCMYVW